ncbi:uncharacterized protein LOC110979566 isoform X2 [Acanthaster planci]|uniref:Uncharacterized protein LOC110979566 isoform X2 n=1 Tax=Acanthaster planci TaxID=133434 RepID=A0A8B7YHT9_ACAPL|nr:uncharacterized protein LOC110979566 isoform X2 [Acanthaster planci]
MINVWSRVYPYCKGPNYHLLSVLVDQGHKFINPITNSFLNWFKPVNLSAFRRSEETTCTCHLINQENLENKKGISSLRRVILLSTCINQENSNLGYNLVKPVDFCINLDASMASRVNKKAAKRKHASSRHTSSDSAHNTRHNTAKDAVCLKYDWSESFIDEDGCSITLNPATGTASFHAKIPRRASPSPPSTSLDQQADGTDTNSMRTASELVTIEATGDVKLTLTSVGGFDIFEANSISVNMTSTKQSTESDSSMCEDYSQHVTKSPLTTEDEELGIDPSLLRHSLERSRSLGDATRAQDASKDRSLKGVKVKKRKRKGSEKVEESLAGGGDEGSEKKTKRLAPNFFVAVQVSNPQIHEALRDVQQTVLSGDEKLKDAMVPIATLHLTIMVMHLATEEDVERAKIALNECHRILSPRFMKEKLSILFGGLGHFNNQVMFAKIKDQDNILESLYEIADTVEKCFSEYQLVSTGERGFKPHLTVMKLSRAPSLRKKGVRRIKSELYKPHNTQMFGMQVVHGLQLCSINKPKSADGYYYKAAEVLFGDPTCSPDRDMHTITEEPSNESLNHIDSQPTADTSELTDTRSSAKSAGCPEQQMDCDDGERSLDTPPCDSPKAESVSESRDISLDVKHQPSSRPICESLINSDSSVAEVDGQKDDLCSHTSSDTTQDTASGVTSDTPGVTTVDTAHSGPSVSSNSTTKGTSDTAQNSSCDPCMDSGVVSTTGATEDSVADSGHHIESGKVDKPDISQAGSKENG